MSSRSTADTQQGELHTSQMLKNFNADRADYMPLDKDLYAYMAKSLVPDVREAIIEMNRITFDVREGTNEIRDQLYWD